MSVQIDDLMVIQGDLDSRIFKLHHTSREATQRDRILALLVELGECANETRAFKYWSTKEASPIDVIAQEFSDVVHFMLSLGIDVNLEITSVTPYETESSLSELFLRAYKLTANLISDFNQETLIDIYQTVFTIAKTLNIEPESIRENYLLKNKINHQRQDDHY